MRKMWTLLSIIDRCNVLVGRAVSWLTLLMVLAGAAIVFARYALHEGAVWLQESVIFMHGIVFLCASAYALSVGAHVRVDFIYERLSLRQRAWVDIIGAIVLLIPFAFSILYFSLSYVRNSWTILERSPDFRGLPGVFLLKTLIWFFAISLLLQALVQIGRGIRVLQGNDPPAESTTAHP
jgi:TRAP-type mannitol/chloroaromatic compound transport system permease small subunit